MPTAQTDPGPGHSGRSASFAASLRRAGPVHAARSIAQPQRGHHRMSLVIAALAALALLATPPTHTAATSVTAPATGPVVNDVIPPLGL
jgi:hypothetical protein